MDFLTFTARPTKPPAPLTPTTEPSERPPLPPPDPIPSTKSTEPFKPSEESNIFLEKPAFIPAAKSISHSPKISPSSIPNPSPSVATTKQGEPGYSNYNNYLYSIPGYSAFQPVSYPGIVQPNQAPLPQTESVTEYVPFPSIPPKEIGGDEKGNTTIEEVKVAPEPLPPKIDPPKSQTDFEEHFIPEIIPAITISEKNQGTECKMNITSLAQGSGATVTIPAQITQPPQVPQSGNTDTKKKTTERFSLKTSIPISKIDMKCVGNPPESILHNTLTKKTIPHSQFQSPKLDSGSRVEIQSNIVIKTATKDPESRSDSIPSPHITNNSISTLINAAEAINKTENQFRKPEPKIDIPHEIKDPPPITAQASNTVRTIFNPINSETNKANFSSKPTEGNYSEQKNQILFIQNKSPSNPKMLVTIQQQNPQVLLQRTNFDSKNMQAPSRLSSQTKKSKDELINENGPSSKVVALKRLHQENCDENDFENLITENQIYGNKIVVKEKSQGTLQEQDLKNKLKIDKQVHAETKNVVLQPNFLYLSNVQFPNLMMIKNNAKVAQNGDSKPIKVTPNENKAINDVTSTNNNSDSNSSVKTPKTQTINTVSKEIHVLKSSNNVLQSLSTKNNKTDLVFQTTNQKVIMNSQIVYQVPMIVETDNKLNQPFINRELPKFISNKKEFSQPFEQTKTNDKLFIACPYQMDSKLQPKIVITNIRPKVTKVEEISSLDIYEKKRRMKRMKYLSNRDPKDKELKHEKKQDKIDHARNVITPEKVTAEIYKEFASTKVMITVGSSDAESDFGEEELKDYDTIIQDYGPIVDDQNEKIEFLSNLNLATHDFYKEKDLERQERILTRDPVASACIAVGRLDRLWNTNSSPEISTTTVIDISTVKTYSSNNTEKETPLSLQRKQLFLNQLKLVQVTPQDREGYEKVWQEIIKERNRRNGVTKSEELMRHPKKAENMDLDTNCQLMILTEIKKSVNDNNNLIKKKLDSCSGDGDGESIKVLAEKNFSELNRLSKMADRSVKIYSGQETRKRDLNPGFDSENIQRPTPKFQEQPYQNYASINIPNISKIISLKTSPEPSFVASSQATSMDEPKNSAAGVNEMFDSQKKQDFSCQVEDILPWPGIETLIKSYKEFDTARKKEIADLQRRNTQLRVDCAHITRSASRDSERARALLAERQNLAVEENNLRVSVQRLCAAIEVIRNC